MFSFSDFASKLKDTALNLKSTLDQTLKEAQHDFERQEQENEERKKQERQAKEKAVISMWRVSSEDRSILEEELKQRIMKISQELKPLFQDVPRKEFPLDVQASTPYAMKAIADDPQIQKAHFKLVPLKMTDERFWRRYFFLVQKHRKDLHVEPIDFPMLAPEQAAIPDEDEAIAVGPGAKKYMEKKLKMESSNRASSKTTLEPTKAAETKDPHFDDFDVHEAEAELLGLSHDVDSAVLSEAAHMHLSAEDFVDVDPELLKTLKADMSSGAGSPSPQSSRKSEASGSGVLVQSASSVVSMDASVTSGTEAASEHKKHDSSNQPADLLELESIESLLANVQFSEATELSADIEKEINASLDDLS